MGRLTRRAVLRSAGSALVLPFLPSLARAEATPPPRLLFWFSPNGVVEDAFVPATEGAGFALPPSLTALTPVDGRFSVFTGIEHTACTHEVAPIRPHDCGTASWLTGVRVWPDEPGIANGISADQVAAAAVGGATPFASLQLGNAGIGLACDTYTCVYQRHVSWASPTAPLPPLTDLQVAFDRMFAGSDPGRSDEETARRRALQHSVLDVVSDRIAAVSSRLSTADRAHLDDYLTGVRELERRVDLVAGTCDAAELDLGASALEAHTRAMADLIVLAFRCDQSRVITFMHGPGSAYHDYGFLGVTGLHHALSHHGNHELTMAPVRTIDAWQLAQLGYLLERLAEVVEPDGSGLLDHTLVAWGSEIGNGNDHAFDRVPVLLAGGEALGVRQGLHRVYDRRPLADLWLGVLERFGVRLDTFGEDGTRPVDLA